MIYTMYIDLTGINGFSEPLTLIGKESDCLKWVNNQILSYGYNGYRLVKKTNCQNVEPYGEIKVINP